MIMKSDLKGDVVEPRYFGIGQKHFSKRKVLNMTYSPNKE
jgi:hypothetical protein